MELFFITQNAGHVIILARLLLLGKVSDNMAALHTMLALKINYIKHVKNEMKIKIEGIIVCIFTLASHSHIT
jgi:hypothetical protein